jgi:hypothetical protein
LTCPFFSPTDRVYDIAFPHPARLPLGASWRGMCDAPGQSHAALSNLELESCNLGYAKSCPRLPQQRACDAVRFAVSKESAERVSLHFVFETDHQPSGYGLLEYDRALRTWTVPHPEPRTQKLAECFLQSYLERQSSISNLGPQP